MLSVWVSFRFPCSKHLQHAVESTPFCHVTVQLLWLVMCQSTATLIVHQCPGKLTRKWLWKRIGNKTPETRMTASVQKQDPNTWTGKRNANLIWQYKTYAHFRGKPLLRNDKTTVKEPLNGDQWKRTYSVLPNTLGIEHTTTKTGKVHFHSSPFNLCLTVVLSLRKRDVSRQIVCFVLSY